MDKTIKQRAFAFVMSDFQIGLSRFVYVGPRAGNSAWLWSPSEEVGTVAFRLFPRPF